MSDDARAKVESSDVDAVTCSLAPVRARVLVPSLSERPRRASITARVVSLHELQKTRIEVYLVRWSLSNRQSGLAAGLETGGLTKHQLVNMYPTKHGHTHCRTTSPQSILLFPRHPPAPLFGFPFPAAAPPPGPPFCWLTPSPPVPPLTMLPAGILLVTHSRIELDILVVVPTTIQATRGREGPRRRRVMDVAGQQIVWRERRRRRVEGSE